VYLYRQARQANYSGTAERHEAARQTPPDQRQKTQNKKTNLKKQEKSEHKKFKTKANKKKIQQGGRV